MNDDERRETLMIDKILCEDRFDFLNSKDKQFILAFTDELDALGYAYDNIGSGFCWGKYMLIYRKAGAKTKTVYARIYMRDSGIVLRLFLNNVTKHAETIKSAPNFIKEVFLGSYGTCKHCKGDACKFRKDYIIDGTKHEKCNGVTFEFYQPTIERLPEYLRLFKAFFPK